MEEDIITKLSGVTEEEVAYLEEKAIGYLDNEKWGKRAVSAGIGIWTSWAQHDRPEGLKVSDIVGVVCVTLSAFEHIKMEEAVRAAKDLVEELNKEVDAAEAS